MPCGHAQKPLAQRGRVEPLSVERPLRDDKTRPGPDRNGQKQPLTGLSLDQPVGAKRHRVQDSQSEHAAERALTQLNNLIWVP